MKNYVSKTSPTTTFARAKPMGLIEFDNYMKGVMSNTGIVATLDEPGFLLEMLGGPSRNTPDYEGYVVWVSKHHMESSYTEVVANSDMKRYTFKSDSSVIVRAKPMTGAEYNAHKNDISIMLDAVVPSNDDSGYLVDGREVTTSNTTSYPCYVRWLPEHYFVENYDEIVEEPNSAEVAMTEDVATAQSVPQSEVTAAFAVVSKAMQTDDGYAQTWHSNLACMMVDAGVPHDAANVHAAQFMNLAFGANTTNCVPVQQSETYVSRYREDIVPGERYVVKSTISRCHQHVDEYYLVNARSANKAISQVRIVTGEESVLVGLFKAEHVNCAWNAPTTEEAACSIIGKCCKPLDTAAIETVRSVTKPFTDYIAFIPELRTGANVTRDNSAYFVDVIDLQPVTKNLRGVNVVTSALKIDTVVNLIGISQVDEMMLRGDMNHTDVIAKTMQVQSLIIKDGEHVFELPVNHLHGSNFQYAVQGNTRTLHLDFVTDGAIMIQVYGEFNLETTCGSVGAAVLNDAPTGKTALQVIGYNLSAFRHKLVAE